MDNNKKRPCPSNSPDPSSNKATSHRLKARKLAQSIPVQSCSTTDTSLDKKPATKSDPTILRMINPLRFAQARAFEINALSSTMDKCFEMAKSRAFQKTPRYLRRRAASHNPKKVPLKYRNKAIQELLTEAPKQNPSKKKKPKSSKNHKLLKSTTKYRFRVHEMNRRQKRSGSWLETHLWHAKRFKMGLMASIKLPITPTQKCARSIYRASRHSTVIHDHSYLSLYEIKGTVADIEHLLGPLFDPNGPRLAANRYTNGLYKNDSFLYAQYPLDLISPVAFLWRSPIDTVRSLWIWIHPLADELLIRTLANRMDALNISTVTVEQITDVSRISVSGPKSLGLVSSVLKLADSPRLGSDSDMPDAQTEPHCDSTSTKGTDRHHGNEFWKSMSNGAVDPDAMRTNQVIALDIWDPRLSYPPNRPSYHRSSTSLDSVFNCITTLVQEPAIIASDQISQSAIWSPETRKACFQSKQTEHQLNTRRHVLHPVPGTKLTPNKDVDTRIPMLLFHSPNAFMMTGGGHAGLDLIVPKGWALPVWRSLVWAGARVAGTQCIRNLAHERKSLVFPWDFPTSQASQVLKQDQANVLEAKWSARPVQKRVNYTKLHVADPFRPNWTAIVPDPWLVSAYLIKKLCGTGAKPSALVKDRLESAVPNLGSAFVHVVVTLVGRGTVDENGLVYEMPSAQEMEWKRRVASKNWSAVNEAGLNHGYMVCDAVHAEAVQRSLIGYTTFGRFSLNAGQCRGMAVVSIGKQYVLVRGTTGHVVYPAQVEFIC